jgi:hypothetical protein
MSMPQIVVISWAILALVFAWMIVNAPLMDFPNE